MKSVVPRLRNLEIEINEIKTLVTEKRSLKEVENVISFDKFQETFSSISFPIPCLEEFIDFDQDLQVNRRDVKEILVSDSFFYLSLFALTTALTSYAFFHRKNTLCQLLIPKLI